MSFSISEFLGFTDNEVVMLNQETQQVSGMSKSENIKDNLREIIQVQ